MSVKLENVSKSFGDVQAVRPSTFEVTEGEFVCLIGPSGCGKTTMLRLLAGLEKPDTGNIWFGDRLVYSKEKQIEVPAEKRGLGMVFQDFALWPHLTVFENVAFSLRARGDTTSVKERVVEALRKVRLEGYEKRYPKQLSGGQQQRVSFARAIVSEPKIILLDEPLSALDAALRDNMRIELKTLTQEMELTAIYVTHDQSEAMSISDRIFLMWDGDILQSGSPEDLYSKPGHLFVAEFVGKTNFLADNKEGEQKRVFRPEHLSVEKSAPDDLDFSGTVSAVSYVGDRYEVILEMDDGLLWTSYFSKRPAIGEKSKVYLSKEYLHEIG